MRRMRRLIPKRNKNTCRLDNLTATRKAVMKLKKNPSDPSRPSVLEARIANPNTTIMLMRIRMVIKKKKALQTRNVSKRSEIKSEVARGNLSSVSLRNSKNPRSTRKKSLMMKNPTKRMTVRTMNLRNMKKNIALRISDVPLIRARQRSLLRRSSLGIRDCRLSSLPMIMITITASQKRL